MSKTIHRKDAKEYNTEQENLRGEDKGRFGRLASFILHPNYEALKGFSEEAQLKVIEDTLSKQLWTHCKLIGWWPDNKKPYEVNKQNDGSYLLTSFLIYERGKSVDVQKDTAGIIGINKK